MKDKKVLFAVIAIIIAFILFWFYWFQLRPIQIRKECLKKVRDDQKSYTQQGKKYRLEFGMIKYRTCLIDKGLKPEDLIPSSLLE